LSILISDPRSALRDPVAALRDGLGASPPAAPEWTTSSHTVQTPIEALGCPAENERGQEPASGSTDENRERRRQIGQRECQGRPDEGAQERDSGSD
jgi:hypothetical protein